MTSVNDFFTDTEYSRELAYRCELANQCNHGLNLWLLASCSFIPVNRWWFEGVSLSSKLCYTNCGGDGVCHSCTCLGGDVGVPSRPYRGTQNFLQTHERLLLSHPDIQSITGPLFTLGYKKKKLLFLPLSNLYFPCPGTMWCSH